MKNKKTLAVFIFYILFTSVRAQIIFNAPGDGSRYNLITPTIIPSQVINGDTSFTEVFLETGDGAFFQFFTKNAASQVFNKPWYFSSSIQRQAVVQLNTFYDTTHRPPYASSFTFTAPVNNDGSNFQYHLNSGLSIGITSSIATILPATVTAIPGDTMTLAVTYKAIPHGEFDTPNNRTIIAIFYNDSRIPNFLSPINNNIPYKFCGTIVNPVRMHHGETIISLADIPLQLQNKLSLYQANFSRVLYIRGANVVSDTEKNIFLSVVPSSNPADYRNKATTVRAVLLDYKSDLSQSSTQAFDQPFAVSFLSRDPNWLTVSPNNFKTKIDAINKPITYHVFFSNVGAGNADSVMINVAIPRGVQCKSSVLKSLSAYIGGSVVTMVSGIPHEPFNTTARRCYYSFDATNSVIHFKIINADLKGSIESNGKNDRGELYFTLKTEDVAHQSYIPSCMLSTVSIKFNNNQKENSSCSIRAGSSNKPACLIIPFASPVIR